MYLENSIITSMKKQISSVHAFHEAFGINNESAPVGAVDEKTYALRYELMREENEEYLEAVQKETWLKLPMRLGT